MAIFFVVLNKAGKEWKVLLGFPAILTFYSVDNILLEMKWGKIYKRETDNITNADRGSSIPPLYFKIICMFVCASVST